MFNCGLARFVVRVWHGCSGSGHWEKTKAVSARLKLRRDDEQHDGRKEQKQRRKNAHHHDNVFVVHK